MKKLYSFLVLSLLLAACTMPPVPTPDDKDGGRTDEASSVYPGTWTYSAVEMSNGTLGTQGQEFGTFTGAGKEIKGAITFSEDKTFTSTLSYTAALNLTIFQQSQQIDVPIEETSMSGSWQDDNGKLSMTLSDGTKLNVSTSNSSRVSFQGVFNQMIPLGQQFNLNATANVVYTCTK